MDTLKFSLIIPAYNAEDFIDDTLNSIFNQTYKNFEILVIDDCSTDNTYSILEKYNNIRLFKTPVNSKQGAGRNIGISNSLGDYILFLDSDDTLFDNNVLQKLANLIKNDKPDLIYMGLKMFGNRNLELMPSKEVYTKEYMLSENPFINVTSICWKTSLIKNNNILFPEKIKYEDVYFAFLGIEKAKSFGYADFFCYKYNNRNNSTTTKSGFEQAIDTIKLIEYLISLKNIISKENIPLLEKRISQQSQRVNVRLDRAIKTHF